MWDTPLVAPPSAAMIQTSFAYAAPLLLLAASVPVQYRTASVTARGLGWRPAQQHRDGVGRVRHVSPLAQGRPLKPCSTMKGNIHSYIVCRSAHIYTPETIKLVHSALTCCRKNTNTLPDDTYLCSRVQVEVGQILQRVCVTMGLVNSQACQLRHVLSCCYKQQQAVRADGTVPQC